MGKTTIVISQSMYFPWAGFLEQVSMADVYVVYDDVQFSKGSFTNRVQAKTAAGSRWLTVPLRDLRLGQRIDEVQANDAEDWRSSQRGILRQAYRDAPFLGEMMDLVDSVLDVPAESIGDLSLRSTLALAGHLGIDPGLRIVHARDLGVGGSGSPRVLDIVRALGGTEYLTGHGARRYLDHEAFERAGIAVSYMRYPCTPYPQLHGAFTPYVSALDLVANCGRDGRRFLNPASIPWSRFLGQTGEPTP
jgi:hypothetical protein